MMRRLTSAPKPAARVAAFMAAMSARVDPQAVAHAVVAGQVARRLGRGDEVVGGQAVDRRPGTDTSSTLAPGGGEGVGGGVEPGQHVGVDAVAQLGDDADPQAVDAVVERRPRSAGAGPGIEVESVGSWPPITSSSAAASATVVANGPIWSRVDAKATSP